MSYPPLAAELIVFSGQMDLERDAVAVLDGVAAAGFRAIECGADYFKGDPQRLVTLLRERGLRVAALHSGAEVDVDGVLRLAEEYETQDLCVSGVGGWEGRAAARYQRDLEALNAAARALAPHGIQVHYHNHAYEFATLDNGQVAIDLISAALDPSVADLCVDVAWVHIGGQDPAPWLRAHADQVGYVHLKDYVGDRHWVELGQGVVPLADVMQVLTELPRVRWAAYEQDTSDHPAAESTARSYRYLADTFGYR